MITMTRIQGSSMGFRNFQKPIIQSPRMGDIFDFQIPIEPQFPNFDLPLAAGSPSGGADGGDAPAPAPAPGPEAPVSDFVVPPTYLFPVQEVPVPTPTTPVVVAPTTSALPTWAIVAGAVVAGIVLAKIL